MRFLRPVEVGDEVSCYCTLDGSDEGTLIVRIETWAQSRDAEDIEKVTERLFSSVAIDEGGRRRPLPNGWMAATDGPTSRRVGW